MSPTHDSDTEAVVRRWATFDLGGMWEMAEDLWTDDVVYREDPLWPGAPHVDPEEARRRLRDG